MPLTNSQYNTIIRTYEERQFIQRHQLEKKLEYVYRHIPGYQALADKVGALSVEHARLLLNGDDYALANLKSSLLSLKNEQKKLLKQAGLSEDFLEPVYICPACKDTGYVDNQKCSCFRQQIISFLYQQSNIEKLLETQNFSNLSYAYYEGEDLSRFQKAVKTCQEFVKSFDTTYHNLFFYGTVGTGKSFLSGCVAKELIDFGHSVIYFSAATLFDRISQNTFDYHTKATLNDLYDDLYSCDLLIIDDLGTEVTNSFSSSQFFSCLNERLLRKKAIIISTNLSLQELRDRYSDRIFSRITSNFDLCKITGPDIRMYKKRILNRK